MTPKGNTALLAILLVSLYQLSSSFSPSLARLSTQHQTTGRNKRNGLTERGKLHIRSFLSVSLDPTTVSSTCENTKVQTAAIEQFISTVQSSLKDETFTSFTLKGPSVPRRKKNSSNEDKDILTQQKEKLRGKYKLITGRLVLLQDKKKKSNKESLYLQANIKFHLATDVAQNWQVSTSESDDDQVLIGLRRLFATAMGIATDEDTDTSKLISEWGASNNEQLGILNGELVTTRGVYKLALQPARKAGFFKTKQKSTENDSLSSKALAHDKQKNVPLSPSSLFFQKLGVTNEDGKPVNGMASKLRQCQKFTEIVGKLVDDYTSTLNDAKAAARVIDMGCGRGYLTFSLHSYLCSKYLSFDASNISSVETQGIDRRPKLIQEINGIANDLGGDFNTLKFVEGTIGITEDNLLENSQLSQNEGSSDSESSNPLDILIALHACDTATDDAMWYAIARKADIIVTAPCCQHELRPQIDRYASLLNKKSDNPLNEILRHAIYRERHTEIVTDAMRAMLLDIAGYDTQVFEFIGGEHTAKNVMITAVKRSDISNEKHIVEKRTKLAELAKMYGVERQRLAMLMGESFGDEEGHKVKSTSGMPPL